MHRNIFYFLVQRFREAFNLKKGRSTGNNQIDNDGLLNHYLMKSEFEMTKKFNIKSSLDPESEKRKFSFYNLDGSQEEKEAKAKELHEILVSEFIQAVKEGYSGVHFDFANVEGYSPEDVMSVAFDNVGESIRDKVNLEPLDVRSKVLKILEMGLASYITVDAENELNRGDVIARIASNTVSA